MAFTDIFSELLSSFSLTEAHADSPPADDDSEDKGEDDGDGEEKGEGGEDEGGEEGGDDDGDDNGGDEEEDEEEEEPEDIKPKLEEECAKSSQCVPLKHHYDACAERVTKQQEDENYKGPKEDCVEEYLRKFDIPMPLPFSFFQRAQWLLDVLLLVMLEDPPVVDRSIREEQERLLGHDIEFEDMTERVVYNKDVAYMDNESRDGAVSGQIATVDGAPEGEGNGPAPQVYRVYKRRWFGLLQLVLMNIVVSWDWLSFSPVANTAAEYFSTTSSIINWLSTAFLFAFVVAAPFTIYALHTGGPRLALITSSLLILSGNWIRYAGTRASPPNFPVTMFGQILIGLAQPFVLSAPTHYSSLWFSPRGRVSATAIASLANPFGGALGQLINPFLATSPSDIPYMTLYIAIISSLATIPSLFIPAAPPTPASASSTHTPIPLNQTLTLLSQNANFILLLLPFAIYVGLFNALSSLLTQILTPYNFSEEDSGIAGALLILVGLLAAAITSPFVDKYKTYLIFIRILVPITALSYLAFIWAPGTRSVASPYIVSSILGASSFSLVPVALEWAVEITWPAGPEAGSTICWSGGQLLGGVFIVVADGLKEGDGEGDPKGNMGKALVFMAVMALGAVPCVAFLGRVGEKGRKGRLEVDKGVRRVSSGG
ncbi:MAG: hypothetical protein Q9209_007678 [Squamulea sp. 1 TL-2023]